MAKAWERIKEWMASNWGTAEMARDAEGDSFGGIGTAQQLQRGGHAHMSTFITPPHTMNM